MGLISARIIQAPLNFSATKLIKKQEIHPACVPNKNQQPEKGLVCYFLGS
jgi:hypothetical protein